MKKRLLALRTTLITHKRLNDDKANCDLGKQILGVIFHVLVDESRDEKVAVVISFLCNMYSTCTWKRKNIKYEKKK